jgi:hypothetical protein
VADPDRGTSRERHPDEVTCVRCLGAYDLMQVDRMLWCDRCVARGRDRAGWWGWVGGAAFGAGVATYIWTVVRPSDLVVGGWMATVIAAVWIGSKVAREIIYGGMRLRNARGVEAPPPAETAMGDPSA